MIYEIWAEETCTALYIVEADSEEEAREAFYNGEAYFDGYKDAHTEDFFIQPRGDLWNLWTG